MVIKHPIDVFVAFLALLPQFLSLGIGLLQLLQSGLHTTNTRRRKFFIDELNSEQVSKPAELSEIVSSADEDLI